MRDFFKQTLATLVGLILFVTLGLGGLIFLVATLAVLGENEGPQVEKQSVLTLNLGRGISDAPPESDPSSLVQEALAGNRRSEPIALRTAVDALESAAKDDRIVGLFVYGNLNALGGTGYATLRELREALQIFRASGKPIYAYDESWAERDYYLTSVANTVVLNPAGVLELNGLRSEMMFFSGALDKYGIGVQVVRAGQYKSAVEPFTRSNFSPQDRQQTQQLLNDIWGEFLGAAASSRKLTPQKLQAIADQSGMLMASEAKAAGLVDRVAYFDQVVEDLRKLTGEKQENKDKEESFRQISLSDYAEVAKVDESKDGKNTIALVYVEGEIVSGNGAPGQVGGDRFARLLRQLRLDKDVKAVVLRINSPGGSAAASDIVTREVGLIRKVKPIVVSMGSVAASGGYQIASPASQIFASANTITGSIGVFGLLPNVQEIANNNGVTWDVVKTGRYADIETFTRPRTPEELAIQQRFVDQIYENFLSTVGQSRSIPRQQMLNIAQGRVWSGEEAKQIGLVDELGGLEAAIQYAAEQAKLGDDWHVEEYPTPQPYGQRLIARLLTLYPGVDASTNANPLTVELQQLQADLETLKSLNDPRGIYTRLWFNPQIE